MGAEVRKPQSMLTTDTRFLWLDENYIVMMVVQSYIDPKNHGTEWMLKMNFIGIVSQYESKPKMAYSNGQE